MNLGDRKEFWDTLCSLNGFNIQEDVDKLEKVIKYPNFLFRYREVNSKTLEALRLNKVYFSSSNYYDDPFDTFLQINIDRIVEEMYICLKDDEKLNLLIDAIITENNPMLNKTMGMDDSSKLDKDLIRTLVNKTSVSNFISNMCGFRNEIKKNIWSVCFSENGFNESLWLKYANQHKGFALMYDLRNDDNFICGKQEKCKKCVMRYIRTQLYPVYYSNDKYDATEFGKYILRTIVAEEFSLHNLLDKIYPVNNNLVWEREKVTLIKKECHRYDEEWRMIFNGNIKPSAIEWIPYGLILGLRMDSNEENLVISLAKQAGINRIYKSYIDKNGNLDAILINKNDN